MSSDNEKNLDYEGGTASVVDMHDAVRRERELLPEGNDSIGITLMVIAAFMLIFGGGYFFSYANNFSASTHRVGYRFDPTKRPNDDGGAAAVDVSWIDSWMKSGKKVYGSCGACHMLDGKGQPGKYPPLKGSEWVNGGTTRLGAIMMRGISGPFTVSKQTYGTAGDIMQAWNTMSDKQIAQVLTYVRRTFGELPEGNDGVVTEEMIAAARTEYGVGGPWNEAGLLAIPENANLPGAKVDLLTGKLVGEGGEEAEAEVK